MYSVTDPIEPNASAGRLIDINHYGLSTHLINSCYLSDILCSNAGSPSVNHHCSAMTLNNTGHDRRNRVDLP